MEAFPEVFNTRIRVTDTSHAATGTACPVGHGATRDARGAERSRDGRDRTSKARHEHLARLRTFLTDVLSPPLPEPQPRAACLRTPRFTY